jgi:hypothetical protein
MQIAEIGKLGRDPDAMRNPKKYKNKKERVGELP